AFIDMVLHPLFAASSFGLSARLWRMSPPFANHQESTTTRLTERRRYQRHALPCECWLEGDAMTIFGPTIDVGVGGLFLRTAIPVAAGTQVDVTLKVSGERLP